MTEPSSNPNPAEESLPAGLRAGGEGALSPERARIIRRFFDGERLRNIPARLKDKGPVLVELLRRIPARESYPEAELNRLLQASHPDFCTLRREMVELGLLERSAGIYRWTEKGRVAVAAHSEGGAGAGSGGDAQAGGSGTNGG